MNSPTDGQSRPPGSDSRQLQIYGESWADRMNRLLRAYRVSQARLGTVIGLSAPMVSQLISGQRVKISNPAVYGRIVRLEELLSSPDILSGDGAAIARVLTDVAASHPVLSTRSTPVLNADPGRDAPDHEDDRTTVIAYLARSARGAQLHATSVTAASMGALGLAALLVEAADRSGSGLDGESPPGQ